MDWRGQSEGMYAQHLAKLKSVLVRKEKGDKPKGQKLTAIPHHDDGKNRLVVRGRRA